VHEKGPQLFQTRWAMNYLAGPLTRVQIPALNNLRQAQQAATPGAAVTTSHIAGLEPSRQVETPVSQPSPGSTTRPVIPSGIPEYFLPNNLTFTQAFKSAGRSYPEEAQSLGLIYRPVLLGQARVRFFNRKYNLDYELLHTALVAEPDRRGVMRWEEMQAAPVDSNSLDGSPDPQARFAPLEAPLTDAKTLNALHKDFLDWAYRASRVSVRANEPLKIYAGPEVSQAEFRSLCAEAARNSRDSELRKVSESYDKKIDALQVKLAREERELSEDETELSQRRLEEYGTHAENVLNLFSRRKSSRRLSTSLSKRRMSEQAKADVQESKEAIETFQKQIALLEEEKTRALEEINERWGEIANQLSEIPVTPSKKDILLDLFGVAWMPYHIVQVGEERVELPGYGT
jgi:hypothetical protein